MNKLEKYFQHPATLPFFGYTQTIMAIIDDNGALLEWNPAFDRLKNNLPSAVRIQDFLSENSQEHFRVMLDSHEIRQTHLELLANFKKSACSCLMTPLPDGLNLFFAEFTHTTNDDEFSSVWLELENTRRMLKLKQIELESVLAQTDEISYMDALTFLANRKKITNDLQLEILRSDRYHKALTIMMLDIDNLKSINDTYGYSAGDKSIRTVACEMLTCIRQIDKLGRLGGDEFLFILPVTTRKTAQFVADRVLDKFRALQIELEENCAVQLTASIGIAQYQIEKESWEELLNRAENALLVSKQDGRNRWTNSNPTSSVRAAHAEPSAR